jgi:uncharacterized RDD family membrane protein YckC
MDADKPMRRLGKPVGDRFVAQICITLIFLIAALAVLLFGLGDRLMGEPTAFWLGAVFAFWLR